MSHEKKLALKNKLHQAVTFSLFGTKEQKKACGRFLERFSSAMLIAQATGSELDYDVFLTDPAASKEKPLELEYIEWFNIPGAGRVFTIRNPMECSDFYHMIGKPTMFRKEGTAESEEMMISEVAPFKQPEHWVGEGHYGWIVLNVETLPRKPKYPFGELIYVTAVKSAKPNFSDVGPETLKTIQEMQTNDSNWWPPCSSNAPAEIPQ